MIKHMSKKSVAIVGARGYSGIELMRWLKGHPGVEIAGLFATAEFNPADITPELRSLPMGQKIEGLQSKADQFDAIFLATPAEISMELAPALMKIHKPHVIDLSGAFRLYDPNESEVNALYKKWYGFEHAAVSWVQNSQYGLASWQSESSKPANSPQLIANPGCFATAALLGLGPLLKSKLIQHQSIVVDAKSGSTGAGKKAEERLLHAEIQDSCSPYRVGRHQHLPELEIALKRHADVQVDLTFQTHLLPIRRGLLTSIYTDLSPEVSAAEIKSAYRQAYETDPLIELIELNNQNEGLMNLNRIASTPFSTIAWRLTNRKLSTFVMIDNLLKGAASQAIENFNRLMGWPKSLSLIPAKEHT